MPAPPAQWTQRYAPQPAGGTPQLGPRDGVVGLAIGLLLLALRETALMGVLLIVHLATVFGLFFSIAYGKFAHFLYRYAALVQNRIELSRANSDGR